MRIDRILSTCFQGFHEALLSTLQNDPCVFFLREDLRPLLRNVRFVRQNRTVFKSTVFLGASHADFHGKRKFFVSGSQLS